MIREQGPKGMPEKQREGGLGLVFNSPFICRHAGCMRYSVPIACPLIITHYTEEGRKPVAFPVS